MHLTGKIELTSGLFTEAGPKERNEDCLGIRVPEGDLLATKGIVACIADGVSAASAGKEAAEAAVLGFINDYYETPEPWQVRTSGQRVLTALNRWLVSQGQGQRAAEKGCVTTFTALILKSRTAHVFHIGDTRLYRRTGEGLELITGDHAARVAPHTCYLTRALGLALDPRIDYHRIPIASGDRFLLTTDGIHGSIPRQELESLVSAPGDAQSCACAIGAATAHSPDNRSCIVLDVGNLPDGDKDDVFRELSALPFPPDLHPGHIIDGLRVEGTLSESKSSRLYWVRDTLDHDRRLVMKAPSANFSDDPSYLERFALEEWIGLRADSPHLVRSVRRDHPRRFLYHLMEPVDGLTLGQWCERNPGPVPGTVVDLVAQIVDGVRALHRKDTLHQDLKPDNILVDGEGRVRIIDYGSCHIGGISEITSPFHRSPAPGTLGFSAPEYRLGALPTRLSDLFSIAAVAYHLLTGGHDPYGKAWETARTPRDFRNLKYIPAATHQPLVPPWMDEALRKALSISPDARHDSMSEFIHNLRQPAPELLTAGVPFVERHPLRFWKCLALFFAILSVVLALLMASD